MSRELFGTDGVRGLANEYPLDDAGSEAIGRAVGTYFAKAGQQIVIACDTRESSERIVRQVAKGLQGVGVRVVFIGVLPTPGLAYITAQHDNFVAGVMITASHNPYEFNGVKVFGPDGGKLPDDTEEKVSHDIAHGVPDRSGGSYEARPELAQEYEDFLVASAGGASFSNMHLVVDAAHGAAFGVAARVFERLRARVTPLAVSPNGRNINVASGATDPSAAQQLVVSGQADLGIVLDGDADRLILIDHLGRVFDGDHILYLLAVGLEKTTVVATVMSNLGAEQALAAHSIAMVRTAVGDRYVLEYMVEHGDTLGGEQSGHIIMTDLSTTGDGLLAAVQVLCVLKNSGKSLAAWNEEVETVPQALVNFRIEDKMRLNIPEVQDYIRVKSAELGNTGRILVRPSGTEPLARVMVEAPNANDLAQEMATHIAELVQ